MMMIDLRTDLEKARDVRNDKICKEYVRIKGETGASDIRVFRKIGEDMELNALTVRRVIIERGLVKERKRA
jgi:hypothetical protein